MAAASCKTDQSSNSLRRSIDPGLLGAPATAPRQKLFCLCRTTAAPTAHGAHGRLTVRRLYRRPNGAVHGKLRQRGTASCSRFSLEQAGRYQPLVSRPQQFLQPRSVLSVASRSALPRDGGQKPDGRSSCTKHNARTTPGHGTALARRSTRIIVGSAPSTQQGDRSQGSRAMRSPGSSTKWGHPTSGAAAGLVKGRKRWTRGLCAPLNSPPHVRSRLFPLEPGCYRRI
jgi:hypothetical protein